MALFKDLPKVMKAALAVLAAVILCEAVYVLARGTAKKAESIKTLKVEGLTLCADGEPVVFKGVSLGWHNIWPWFYNSGTVKSLHDDWGVEIFRAAIGADSHAKADNPDCLGGYIDDPQTALKCAFKVIDAAIQNKAYVIVDWHSHILHPEEAADFFGKVASKYAGVPNVIYELFNEPVCRSFEDSFSYSDLGDPEAMASYWDELKEYADKASAVIDKYTFGSDRLGELLKSDYSDVKEVELIGICTDICVISNALLTKAFLPNAHVKVDASCCAGVTPDSHNTALNAMKACHIEVTG
jgi:nicotinamidase-related amidase